VKSDAGEPFVGRPFQQFGGVLLGIVLGLVTKDGSRSLEVPKTPGVLGHAVDDLVMDVRGLERSPDEPTHVAGAYPDREVPLLKWTILEEAETKTDDLETCLVSVQSSRGLSKTLRDGVHLALGRYGT